MEAFIVLGFGALIAFALVKRQSIEEEVASITEMYQASIPSPAPAAPLDGGDPVAVALPIIRNFEDFSARPYEDPPKSGKFSIAYGHQIQPGDPYTSASVISRDEGEQLLYNDVTDKLACISRNVKVSLTTNQTAALISFVYNEGCSHFEDSTMLRLINAGDFEGAAAQFPEWVFVHVAGVKSISQDLVSRRQQEQYLFQTA